MNKVIILLGQRVRSGTNFVGSTLAQHPSITTLPTNKSIGEFNLFTDDSIITEVFDKVIKKSFSMDLSKEDQSKFLENYGNFWLHLMIDKYSIPEDAVLFLKSPYVLHLDLWKQTFPNSQISVICRDGRDNVISSIKASNDKRSWYTPLMKFKKYVNFYSGRFFINHTKQWVITARHILKIEENSQVKIFKYESLIDSKTGILELFKHFQLESNSEIIEKCINAPVVGSSFGLNINKISKTNWLPDYDKSKYNFTNKWLHWGIIKKSAFKILGGKELIDLSYEKKSNW